MSIYTQRIFGMFVKDKFFAKIFLVIGQLNMSLYQKVEW